MSESLNKRLDYLGIADMDYLSARLLLLSGLTHTGLAKASEAFEKLLKLFFLLEAKINSDSELEKNEVEKYRHQLVKLFCYIRTKIPAVFDDSWIEYFQELERAYKLRYPESWKESKLTNDLERLDKAYCYFRNGVILNFPQEESKKTKEFGTFIYRAYSQEIIGKIKQLGSLTPKEIFYKNNESAQDFVLDFHKL